MKKTFIFFMSLLAAICLIGCKNKKEDVEKIGKFYTLQEAYDNKFLNIDDLEKIANLYNSNIVGKLDDKEQEEEIKKTYLKQLQEKVSNAKIEDVFIRNYFGTYGDCVVVCVWDVCISYDLFFEDVTIGSVTFKDYCSRCISVYKQS